MDNSKNFADLYESPPKYTESVYFRVGERFSAPTYRRHWHENIEIQYIIEGTNIAQCDNEIVEADKDSFFIINSRELHQSVGGKRRHTLIQFSPSLFGKNEIVLKRLVKDAYLSEIMQKMIAEYYKDDDFSKLNIQGYAYLLITHLYRNYSYKTDNERAHKNHSEKREILKASINYIHDNYNKDISLSVVADMANVSKYHFCNIFKEFTGQTFKEYHNLLRINKAIELLGITDMSIAEISLSCGFNDPNYFTRKFRQITGKTPVAVREQLKQEAFVEQGG